MIVCPQCGKESVSNSRYCDNCGFAFSDGEGLANAPDLVSTSSEAGTQTTNLPWSWERTARRDPADFGDAVKACFWRGGTRGRASRSEFWYWQLFVFLTLVLPTVAALFFLDFSVEISLRLSEETADVARIAAATSLTTPILWGLVCLKLSFDVICRRLHDVGLPGFWLELLPIFLLGVIIIRRFASDAVFCGFLTPLFLYVFIVALIPGTKGPNKYGPLPFKRKEYAKNRGWSISVCPQCGKGFTEDVARCDSCGGDVISLYGTNASTSRILRAAIRRIKTVISETFRINGRASCSVCWSWAFLIFATVVLPASPSVYSICSKGGISVFDAASLCFAFVAALILAIPSFTLMIRRFHDFNVSTGVLSLVSIILGLVFLTGVVASVETWSLTIALIVLQVIVALTLLVPGNPCANQYDRTKWWER